MADRDPGEGHREPHGAGGRAAAARNRARAWHRLPLPGHAPAPGRAHQLYGQAAHTATPAEQLRHGGVSGDHRARHADVAAGFCPPGRRGRCRAEPGDQAKLFQDHPDAAGLVSRPAQNSQKILRKAVGSRRLYSSWMRRAGLPAGPPSGRPGSGASGGCTGERNAGIRSPAAGRGAGGRGRDGGSGAFIPAPGARRCRTGAGGETTPHQTTPHHADASVPIRHCRDLCSQSEHAYYAVACPPPERKR